MGNDFNDLKFDAHQYARDFEAIAVKIVVKLFFRAELRKLPGIMVSTESSL